MEKRKTWTWNGEKMKIWGDKNSTVATEANAHYQQIRKICRTAERESNRKKTSNGINGRERRWTWRKERKKPDLIPLTICRGDLDLAKSRSVGRLDRVRASGHMVKSAFRYKRLRLSQMESTISYGVGYLRVTVVRRYSISALYI